MLDLASATPETFTPHLETTFDVGGDTHAVPPLRLITVETAGDATVPDARPPFLLIFGAPGAHALAQGIHPLHHDGLGELELFLVPIAPEAGDARYQAVFS
jgi:hypothetical protein